MLLNGKPLDYSMYELLNSASCQESFIKRCGKKPLVIKGMSHLEIQKKTQLLHFTSRNNISLRQLWKPKSSLLKATLTIVLATVMLGSIVIYGGLFITKQTLSIQQTSYDPGLRFIRLNLPPEKPPGFFRDIYAEFAKYPGYLTLFNLKDNHLVFEFLIPLADSDSWDVLFSTLENRLLNRGSQQRRIMGNYLIVRGEYGLNQTQ